MSKYRMVHKCDKCGKIYRSEYWPNIYAGSLSQMVCGKCGARNKFIKVAAKPRLLGLLGWEEVKNERYSIF